MRPWSWDDAGSHVHAPPAHSWPVLHAEHAAPPLPHLALVVVVTHVSPSQQPLGHDAASQTHLPVLPSHSCPWAHATHETPASPQAPDVGVTHWPLALQHPEGHDAGSHAHSDHGDHGGHGSCCRRFRRVG